MGQVFAEIGFQLFDTIDQGQHQLTGTLMGGVAWPECGNLVVEMTAQRFLHHCRRAVRHDFAHIFEQAAQQHDTGDARYWPGEFGERCPRENLTDQPAKQSQASDARGGG